MGDLLKLLGLMLMLTIPIHFELCVYHLTLQIGTIIHVQ